MSDYTNSDHRTRLLVLRGGDGAFDAGDRQEHVNFSATVRLRCGVGRLYCVKFDPLDKLCKPRGVVRGAARVTLARLSSAAIEVNCHTVRCHDIYANHCI